MSLALLGIAIGFGRSRVVRRPLDYYRSTHLLLRFGLCLRMLTWDRARLLGENRGLSVVKGGESDVESRHLQDCGPCLCRLRTDGLASASRYWTYWSHAGDMGLVNRCSLLLTDDWFSRLLQWLLWERNYVWTHGSVSRRALNWDESLFSWGQWICSTMLMTSEMLPHTRTARKKRMSGVCELVWEAYVSCVSGFPCMVYIDLNHRDSQIWVTIYLVTVIT
jgi:hypothetical protein